MVLVHWDKVRLRVMRRLPVWYVAEEKERGVVDWAVAKNVCAQSAGIRRHIQEVFHAQKKNVPNAEQS